MPRSFLNTVRGYREKTYWENGASESQNVMKTRSGLTIKTVPSARGFKGCVQPPQLLPEPTTTFSTTTREVKPVPKCNKTLNSLSFVTRFQMLLNGAKLDFSGYNVCEAAESPVPEMQEEPQGVPGTSHFQKQLADLGLQVKTCTRPEKVHLSPAKFGINLDIPLDQKSKKIKTLVSFSPTKHPRPSTTPMVVPPGQQLLSHLYSSGATCIKTEGFNCVPGLTSTRFPLLYNNKPLMVVSRTCAWLQPPPRGPAFSPSKVPTVPSRPPTPVTPKKEPGMTTNMSPMRRRDMDATTDEDSDTCSQGSQDSNISEFDLSVFQMESHAFTTDANGNQIHKCKICERVFTVFSAYKAHVTCHVKSNNRCNTCGKIFSRAWLLKGHLRTHTGEKPFQCPHSGCDKRFADKSNLRSHQLIHQVGNKVFVCPKCHRAFAQKRYLHKHRLEVCKI